MIEVSIVCVTVLASLVLTLRYFQSYRLERTSWLEAVRGEVLETVDERLSLQANYQKDLEIVNANQLKLAQEIDLLKKTQLIQTRLGRPPGSIV